MISAIKEIKTRYLILIIFGVWAVLAIIFKGINPYPPMDIEISKLKKKVLKTLKAKFKLKDAKTIAEYLIFSISFLPF